MIYSLIGEPVEHLMRQLQAIDERSGGLLDLLSNPVLNPIRKCLSTICRLLLFGCNAAALSLPGDQGAFVPIQDYIWAHVAHDDVDSVQSTLVFDWWGVGLDVSSQLWWRFLHLKGFPYRLADAVVAKQPPPGAPLLGVHGPRDEHKRRLAVGRDFFKSSLHPCCREPNFDEKVHLEHWQGDVEQSACSVARDRDFWSLMQAWARFAFRFTNMCQERALAKLQHATRGDARVDMERFCAAGFLRHSLLTDHISLGRADPTVETREQVLQAGVPIQAARGDDFKMPS